MTGRSQTEDDGGSSADLAGRLARLRARFEAAWDVADAGGTLPDTDAYLDGLSEAELPAARLLLESVDRARRARLGPIPPSAFDAPTIDTSVDSPAPPPNPTSGSAGEATTVLDPVPEPTRQPELTMAATGIFEAGIGTDEPPPTLPLTRDPHATVDLPTTVAVSSGWSNRGKPGLAAAQAVPGYEILGELGRGGMGVVYKARQVRADRLVALKMVLAGAHAGEDQLARFAIEAQAVAHLQHPGIVQIYDVGEHNGLPYFSLEFVEGGSLAQYIGGKPQSPRRAAEIVAELADAMAAAHARYIVHRDLKPANVLLTADGRPKITDFGLAKKLEGDSEQTRSGAIMGTPSYMSPEQAFGLTHEIGPAADQYALGAILYELLTGRPPFQGATPYETLDLVRNEEPVPPRRLQPKVPVDIETIALKALQKEIPKRYADSAALARDLRRYLDNEPIEARPVSFAERSWRWCRRNPRVASLTAAVAALVLLGLVGSTTAAIELNNRRALLVTKNLDLAIQKQKAEAAKVLAEKKEKEAVAARKAEELAKLEAEKKQKEAIEAQKAEEQAKLLAQEEKRKAYEVVLKAWAQNKNALEAIRFISVLANKRLLGIPGTREVRAEMLKVAGMTLKDNIDLIEALAPIANDKVTRPVAFRTMIGIHQKEARLAQEIRKIDEASKLFEMMQKESESLLAQYPEAMESHKVFAATSNTLGDFLMDHIGDAPRARTLYEGALEARRTWLEMALAAKRDDPKDAANYAQQEEFAREGIAVNLGLLSKVWFELGDPVKALDYTEQEREARNGLRPRSQEAVQIRREHAFMLRRLGEIRVRLGDRVAGRKEYQAFAAEIEAIATDYRNIFEVKHDAIQALQTVGHASLMLDGDPASALETYRSALADFRKMLAADPTNGTLQDDVSTAEYYVATAYHGLHNESEADQHYRESLRVRLPLIPIDKADIDQIPLMIVLARCGEFAESAAIADAMAAKPNLDNRTTFYIAHAYALCAGAVAKGRPAGTLSDDEAALHRKFLNRSYELLRKNLARGWRNPVELEIEPDLEHLRQDPDFPKLLDEARRAAVAPR